MADQRAIPIRPTAARKLEAGDQAPDPVPLSSEQAEAGSHDFGAQKRWTGSVEQIFTQRARDQPVSKDTGWSPYALRSEPHH